jgi:hypothetical protein
MTTMRVVWMMVALGLGLVAGCSTQSRSGPPEPDLGELREVNDMLHAGSGRGGKFATKLADLTRFHNMYPLGYEAVKSGNVVVLWNTPPKDEGELGKDEAIMAYAKNVPTDGGYVLLSAGTVKKMSASEFNAALPKAAAK